jgi:GT2 family glycosyltransferase/glycosyltransferase involved in cell wall biosynthesis
MSRLIRLFKAYRDQHGAIQLRDFALHDSAGRPLGHVDRCELGRGWVRVTGWTLADQVALSAEGETVATAPRLSRPDVSRLHGLEPARRTGFTLRLDRPSRDASFCVHHGDDHRAYPIAPLTRGMSARLTLRLVPRFLRDLMRAVPAGWRWYRQRDRASAVQVFRIMGIAIEETDLRLDARLFDDAPPEDPLRTSITIIMPIYNAMDLLPEVLDRVLRHTDLPYRLILVEDCSSDTRVRPWLRAWRDGLTEDQARRVKLMENETNLGFVGTVNRAFGEALPLGHHVVLLNSDAFVPEGWASRLLRPIVTGRDVASVTPLSNDAEIFTVPRIGAPSGLPQGAADRLDAVARRFAPDATLAEAPTGVGFCMAMNIAYLARQPRFDEKFGRGYGEEVDWCQKTRALGGRHVGLAGLFVEHRGGESFGSAEKTALIQRASALISRRYPSYDAEVQAFIRRDPFITPRLALALVRAGEVTQDPVPVYLAHDMGGGAETHLQSLIADGLEEGTPAVVLRVGGMVRWQLELHGPGGVTRGTSEDTRLIARLIGLLPRRRVIYSCGVGDEHAIGLPGFLRELAGRAPDTPGADSDTDTDIAQRAHHPLEVLFHDYFPLSPSFNLLNGEGVFTGVPPRDSTDPAHQSIASDGRAVGLTEWRTEWGALLAEADRITTFSQSSRDLVCEAYPDCAPRIEVTPHALPHDIPAIAPPRDAQDPPVIGVLGAIGYPKGIAVLAELSRYLEETGRARLVVLGVVEERYPLAPGAKVHGPYSPAEIPALVARYGISRWFIPSICPETFSFTTHECIATGLPVFSFDLGAQGEAVARASRKTGQGGTIPLGAGPEALTDALLCERAFARDQAS